MSSSTPAGGSGRPLRIAGRLGVYRVFAASHPDEGGPPPLQCSIGIQLEHRQGVAFNLNAVDALTEHQPRRAIPLDELLERKMESHVSFPASLCGLQLGDDGSYYMELNLKFSRS